MLCTINTESALAKTLATLAWTEGTGASPVTKNFGYDVLVGGINGLAIFTDYSAHPLVGKPPVVVKLVPRLLSSAAGRYQLLARYFTVYKQQLNLPDFSPESQDRIALQQIKERGVNANLLETNFEQAITRLSSIWASLPGNTYKQGGKTMQQVAEYYNSL
jgi:muramidase (phage lysozyme)